MPPELASALVDRLHRHADALRHGGSNLSELKTDLRSAAAFIVWADAERTRLWQELQEARDQAKGAQILYEQMKIEAADRVRAAEVERDAVKASNVSA